MGTRELSHAGSDGKGAAYDCFVARSPPPPGRPSADLLHFPDAQTLKLWQLIRYSGPDAEMERLLFRSWTDASLKEARSVLFPSPECGPLHCAAEQAAAARDDFLSRVQAVAVGCGWLYDASARRFLAVSPGIDALPDTTFFTHMPLGVDAVPTLPPVGFVHKYLLRVVSPDTLATQHELTPAILQQWLIKRYYGALPRNVAVITAAPAADAARLVSFPRGTGIPGCVPDPTVTVLPLAAPAAAGGAGSGAAAAAVQTLAQAVNRQLHAALCLDCDLILLDLREHGDGAAAEADMAIQLDWLVPAYPVVLAPSVMLLTPLQVAQVNGPDPRADTPRMVVRSLLRRVAAPLGALLITPAGAASVPEKLPSDPDWCMAGISSLRLGMVRDARVHKVVPSMSRFVPQLRHGWLMSGTANLLAAAMEVTDPWAILELGSWYGKSTRFMLSMARCDATIYAVDHFKNNAHYSGAMWKLGPLDKMYLRHLRYETFHANVAPYVGKVAAAAASPASSASGSVSSRCECSAHSAASAASDEPERRVVMMKMDALEAIDLLAVQDIQPQLVFIDCEKKRGPLRDLILHIQDAFPDAVIVGDDYLFPSVQEAVDDLGLPFVLCTEEAYAIFPSEKLWRAAAAASDRWVAALADSPLDTSIERLVKAERWSDAVVAATTPAYTGPSSSHDAVLSSAAASQAVLQQRVPGCSSEFLTHEVCRTRDPAVLAPLWGKLFGGCEEWTAPMLLNHMNLTPFDYLAHNIKWG